MSHQLDQLFPTISTAPSTTSLRWPGHSSDSAETAKELLKENHVKYHTYFDPRGFHNHVSHYILALYALGAHKETIEAAYAHETSYQAPAVVPPGPITPENFNDHSGDDKYYESFRQYFANLITKGGVSAILEFVFNVPGNFKKEEDGSFAPKQREMLNRLLDGLLHPIIHVGYGVEFGLPGLVVEGLAAAAVHRGDNTPLLPPSFWDRTGFAKEGEHAFTILARIINDPQFDKSEVKVLPDIPDVGKKYGQAINNYVKQWGFDSEKEGEVQRKIEEIVWSNVLLYGVGGWEGANADYKANFFRRHPRYLLLNRMHLVTSSLFLNAICAQLKPQTAELFLRAYFSICLAWWIDRGQKALDIEGFMTQDTAYPTPPEATGPVRPNAVPSTTSPLATTPNPWFPLISTALTLPEDHLVKLYRALATFGSVYGNRKAGDFTGTELMGAELLDGTLFVRVAGLTEKRVREHPTFNQKRLLIWDGLPPPNASRSASS